MRVFTLLSVFVLGIHQAAADPSKANTFQKARVFPEIALRGYGKVSGRFLETQAKDASLLELVCEDEAKAKLTQAKYLSDLALLPGVHPIVLETSRGKLNAWAAEGQGMVAAVQIAKKVYIAAGKDESALIRVLKESTANVAKRSSKAVTEVPMWLDRWDKFGFRFYYSPWTTPPGTKTGSDYDITKEFEFAEKNDRSGLLLWANRNEIDTAEGLSNEGFWYWALRETAAKKLPVSLNIQSGGNGMGASWFFNRYRNQLTSKMPQFCGAFYTVATPYFGGPGMLSWSATTAKDTDLGMLQDIVRRSMKYPNVTTILEPHGELRHGAHDIFIEYGPVADAGYRKFLQARYPDLNALNAAWGTRFVRWEDIRVPEVASFLGTAGSGSYWDLAGRV